MLQIAAMESHFIYPEMPLRSGYLLLANVPDRNGLERIFFIDIPFYVNGAFK